MIQPYVEILELRPESILFGYIPSVPDASHYNTGNTGMP